jgi:hypothetical protein
LQDAALDLIALDRFKQCLEIFLAKALIALTLDHFKEYWSDLVLGKYLQQKSSALGSRSINQNLLGAQTLDIFAVTRKAFVDRVVIGIRGRKELNATVIQGIDGRKNIRRSESNVLDPLAFVRFEVLRDLGSIVGGFINWNANLSARTCHRAATQSSLLSLDIEKANFAKIEDALVELRLVTHAPLVNVVGEMVDRLDSGLRCRGSSIRRREIDVVDCPVAVAVNEVDQTAANPLDRRDIKLHRTDRPLVWFGTEFDRTIERRRRVGHAKRHCTGTRPVHLCESSSKAIRLGIDDKVDVALPE